MEKINSNIVIDVADNMPRKFVTAKQYDANSRTITVNLVNRGIPYNLIDCKVRLFAQKTDGTIVFHDCEIIDASKGEVLINITSQLLIATDAIKCELTIYSGTQILATAIWQLLVNYTLRNDKAIESTNDFTALTNALVTTSEANERAERALAKAEEAVEVVNAITSDWEATKKTLTDGLDDLAKLTVYEKTTTETKEVDVTWEDGYVTEKGVTLGLGNYCHCSISVQKGDVIDKFYRQHGAAIQIASSRFICAKKDGVVVESAGSGTAVGFPYTVTADVDEIILSVSYAYHTYASYVVIARAEQTLRPNITVAEKELIKAKAESVISQGAISYNFDVAPDKSFESSENYQNIVGYTICFCGNISDDISGVTRIGRGLDEKYGGGIGFDGANLYQYMDTASSAVRTQPHGLTLKDYVSVIIDVGWGKTANVTISTNGGMYKWSIPFFRAYRGTFRVASENIITNCKLSYTSAALATSTWIYGDSYCMYTDDTRWTYYLIATGHTDYMINAYGGKASAEALQSLKYDLDLGCKPKRIIWAVGMNDKDTSSAANQSWQTALDEVISICSKYDIDLILATIPNTPSANTLNTYKNTIVRDSGYRYIDFAGAVNGVADNAPWYDGMIHSDNVHPAVQGAIALYNAAITTVPELLN